MDMIDGVVIGLVTKVRPGQVKVNFPWLADEHESDWIRIATAMSGNNRGSFFMPELHDEVLVAFEQGDPRAPLNHPLIFLMFFQCVRMHG